MHLLEKAHRPPRVAGSVLFGLCTRDDDFTSVNNNIVYKYLCINGLCTSKLAKGCGQGLSKRSGRKVYS